VYRWLQVYGNPLGCVLVPDSVTSFDTNAVYDGGYDKTARCGDSCTELTVYVPSDGVCVQCPDDLRVPGVGALDCSVLRCSVGACMHVYVYMHTYIHISTCNSYTATRCNRMRWSACVLYVCIYASVYVYVRRMQTPRGWEAHQVLSCETFLLQSLVTCCSVMHCVAVCGPPSAFM